MDHLGSYNKIIDEIIEEISGKGLMTGQDIANKIAGVIFLTLQRQGYDIVAEYGEEVCLKKWHDYIDMISTIEVKIQQGQQNLTQGVDRDNQLKFDVSKISPKYRNKQQFQELYRIYVEESDDGFMQTASRIMLEKIEPSIKKFLKSFVIDNKEKQDIFERYQTKYPLVSKSSILSKLSNNYFHKMVDAFGQFLYVSLPDAARPVVKEGQKIENNMDKYYYIVAGISVCICQALINKSCIKESFVGFWHNQIDELLYAEHCTKANAHCKEILTKIEATVKQQPRQKLIKQSPESTEEVVTELSKSPDKHKEIFDDILKQFSLAIATKMDKQHKEVKNYMIRCYKNQKSVSIKYIEGILGDKYSDEIDIFIRSICHRLDLSIQELEHTMDVARDYLQQDTSMPQDSSDIPTVPKKNRTKELHQHIHGEDSLLTTDVLIDILQQQGYTIWDKKLFVKQAQIFGLDKADKSGLQIKKD